MSIKIDFYSRPCGRGDGRNTAYVAAEAVISTHAPAGGATVAERGEAAEAQFLLTPLREGRQQSLQTNSRLE